MEYTMNNLVGMIMIMCLVAGSICLSACSQAQQGSAQALDNLGSVIKSESKKVWIPKDGSADTEYLEESETQSHNEKDGYYY